MQTFCHRQNGVFLSSTVSRKLDYLCLIDRIRFDDGDRSNKEVMFEVAWEDYLRNHHMKNEFYNKKFNGEPLWLQMLCLRIMRELERRVMVMQEPTGNPFRNLEREIAKIARRRKMSCNFYINEVLARKYAIRRNRYIATYARRIAAKSRDKNTKHTLKQ